jgi:hypothetical protein
VGAPNVGTDVEENGGGWVGGGEAYGSGAGEAYGSGAGEA